MSAPFLKGFPQRLVDGKLVECRGDQWMAHYYGVLEIAERGGIAVLVGGVGTGKTRMATEVARRMQPLIIKVHGLSKSMPCRYLTANKLMSTLKDSFADGDSEAVTEEGLTDATLLVIDELDGGIATDYGQRKLKSAVDERYQRRRPTILITNEPRNGLKRILPPPVIDRIREDGRGFFFDWPSFRAQSSCQPLTIV